MYNFFLSYVSIYKPNVIVLTSINETVVCLGVRRNVSTNSKIMDVYRKEFEGGKFSITIKDARSLCLTDRYANTEATIFLYSVRKTGNRFEEILKKMADLKYTGTVIMGAEFRIIGNGKVKVGDVKLDRKEFRSFKDVCDGLAFDFDAPSLKDVHSDMIFSRRAYLIDTLAFSAVENEARASSLITDKEAERIRNAKSTDEESRRFQDCVQDGGSDAVETFLEVLLKTHKYRIFEYLLTTDDSTWFMKKYRSEYRKEFGRGKFSVTIKDPRSLRLTDLKTGTWATIFLFSVTKEWNRFNEILKKLENPNYKGTVIMGAKFWLFGNKKVKVGDVELNREEFKAFRDVCDNYLGPVFHFDGPSLAGFERDMIVSQRPFLAHNLQYCTIENQARASGLISEEVAERMRYAGTTMEDQCGVFQDYLTKKGIDGVDTFLEVFFKTNKDLIVEHLLTTNDSDWFMQKYRFGI